MIFVGRVLFLAGALFLAYLTLAVVVTNWRESRRDLP